MRRSDQRRDAAFALYQRDVTGRPLDELLAGGKPFTHALAGGVDVRLAEIDEAIGTHSHGWTIERIAPLERAIMRVAVYEIRYSEEVPVPVAIDEAVNLARRYCGAEAPGFVNGILAAVAAERSAAEGARA